MALREKFGRLVLLEETDSGPLGNEYRAARLGPSGLDRLVTVLRFSPAIAAHAEASKRLVEEARLAAQIHNPGIVRVLGVGRVGSSFYVSTELVEGRTARAVLACCRDEGFPFGADHALMIASRASAGLELLHGRRDDAGRPLLHGLVSPRQLVVAFDGEVKLKGLGLWSALGDIDLLAPEERAYLAPEQASTRGDPRSDVYGLGLVLLEALSGQPTDASDPLERLAQARFTGASGEVSRLPRPLADLLRRALASDPAARFSGMAEFRKAIDTLLFSGDFTPTTFDLAFFMHTLFRAEVEREARAIDEARAGDYREFMADDAAKAAAAGPADTEPADPGSPATPRTDAAGAAPTLVPPPTVPDPRRPGPAGSGSPPRSAAAAGPDSSQSRARIAREPRLSLGAAPAGRGVSRSLGLVVGLLAAVLVGGGAGWFYFVSGRRVAPSPVASPEQAAAEARVRELEARIATLEREKAEAESRAADEARAEVEQKAATGGQRADPAAIERAQETARRRAREEQQRQQQQELERLADEKRTEQQRLADAIAAATPAPTAVATPVPTPVATVTPTPAPLAAPAATSTQAGDGTTSSTEVAAPATPPTPVASPVTSAPTPSPSPSAAVRPGMLVDITDPALTPPELVSQPRVEYPDIAVAARAEGVVELRALVDETGSVIDVTVVRCSRSGVRFEQNAERHARGRKYRPATKGGVAVRTWLPIVVNFKLTR